MIAAGQYPWDGIPRPAATAVYESQKVDPFSDVDVYWTVDTQGRFGVLVSFVDSGESALKLPKLKRLAVEFRPDTETGKMVLLFILEDGSLKRVFYEFCRGLIDDVLSASTPGDGVRRAVAHTWLWQRFLRGQSAELSDEEQRGLIGELTFLREHLVPKVGWRTAVDCWTGPLGTPKDFQWVTTAVEIKTHLASARPIIVVSSEFQLDIEGFDAVWLVVFEFLAPTPSSPSVVSLGGLVADTRQQLMVEAPDAIEGFEMKLHSAGYADTHDYSDSRWLVGTPKIYLVGPDFPAIRSAGLPNGVESVSYRLHLSAIQHWLDESGQALQSHGANP